MVKDKVPKSCHKVPKSCQNNNWFKKITRLVFHIAILISSYISRLRNLSPYSYKEFVLLENLKNWGNSVKILSSNSHTWKNFKKTNIRRIYLFCLREINVKIMMEHQCSLWHLHRVFSLKFRFLSLPRSLVVTDS